jgi:hypothetical protein
MTDALKQVLLDVEALARDLVRQLDQPGRLDPLVLARALVSADLTRADLRRMGRELAGGGEASPT